MVAYVAEQTRGLCLGCFDEGMDDLRTAEVMVRGARVVIPTTGKKKRKRKKKTSPDAEHARRAAWRRLALLHPAMFEMLYDEERVRRGLPPVVRRTRRDWTQVASETLGFEEVYDALQPLGDLDA